MLRVPQRPINIADSSQRRILRDRPSAVRARSRLDQAVRAQSAQKTPDHDRMRGGRFGHLGGGRHAARGLNQDQKSANCRSETPPGPIRNHFGYRLLDPALD